MIFCYRRDLKMSWLEHFHRFNKWGMWNKNALGEKFLKINKRGAGDIHQRPESILHKKF